MQQHFATIEALEDFSAILRYSAEVCREHGVVRQSYHLTPRFEPLNSMRVRVYAEGFRPEWVERYAQSDFRSSNPIPERVLKHGALLSWQAAMRAAPNTAAHEAYFRAMEEEGLVHGFGLPLFGPRGRDGYASLDFGYPLADVPDEQLGIVRAIPQAAHQRICVLLNAREALPDLSSREREVLEWVARGKSVTSIAAILGLSPDTVKTYSRRVYAKLDVTDRVGATVTALKHGLVRI